MSETTQLVKFDISEEQIGRAGAKCQAMGFDTPQRYEEGRKALADIRRIRVAVEKRRVDLKAEALAFGRKVDTRAKELTALLTAIEDPLAAKKAIVDDEKARIKREAEEAMQREADAAALAARELEEARIKAEREAEQARLAEERARLDEERKALDEERRKADEQARADRAKLDEERRIAEEAARMERDQLEAARRGIEAAERTMRETLEAERRAVAEEREQNERLERERQAQIKAAADAAARAEADRLAAIEQQARLDAFKPDAEKIRSFAVTLRKVRAPDVRTDEGKRLAAWAMQAIGDVATQLENGIKP